MFSGIVEGKGAVTEFSEKTHRLALRVPFRLEAVRLGDSVCVSGVCLTVVQIVAENTLVFDVAEETLRRTTLGTLRAQDSVNVERSLLVSDRIHGHFVFGHVDCIGRLVRRETDGLTERLVFSCEESFIKFLAPKGSVTISGVSLTVGEVDEKSFSVYIVPHTASLTTLSELREGDGVNLEADMLSRYVVRHLGERGLVRGGASER
ncbi:MAG: riboflavin synthase [Bdellovibrionales bacterium]|nr:riboflavin synthase [Bdellovibrionales bacterium]